MTAALSLPKMQASATHLTRVLIPNILAATAMAAVVHYSAHLIAGYAPKEQLLLLMLIGALSYFGLLYSLARSELSEIYTLITTRKLPQ